MNPLRSFFIQLSRIPPAAMLVMIVGLALVVTLMVSNFLKEKQDAYTTSMNEYNQKLNATTKVVVALKDIPEGQTIPSDALEERPVPQTKAPQDSISSTALVAGHVAKYGISANAIVSQHDLAPQGAPGSFSSRLKEGMRAITFAVDANSGVAGFVNPESRVDIISMVGSGADTKAAPILSDVEVIAVGQTSERSPNNSAMPSSSVTVAVTPEDGQRLIKGICASKLYLSLRNDKDHTPIPTRDVISMFGKSGRLGGGDDSMRNALSQLPPPSSSMLPPPPEVGGTIAATVPLPPRNFEVETWSGSKKDLVTFAGQ